MVALDVNDAMHQIPTTVMNCCDMYIHHQQRAFDSTPRISDAALGTHTLYFTFWDNDGLTILHSATATLEIVDSRVLPTLSFTLASFTYGVTTPITVTTSVAGTVRFLANNKVIKNCKARPTSTLNSSFIATCSYRTSTRRQLTITAILTPTNTGFSTLTSTSGTFHVARRSENRS